MVEQWTIQTKSRAREYSAWFSSIVQGQGNKDQPVEEHLQASKIRIPNQTAIQNHIRHMLEGNQSPITEINPKNREVQW